MVLCIGEAVIDMFYKQQYFYPLPGGCTYNTSIALGRLGAQVSFLGRISKNFFGDIQVKRLRENNVNTDFIIRCEENPILAFIKTEEGKNPEYAFYEEGTADRLLSAKDLPSAIPLGTTCIAFGSVSMLMEPIATTIETLIFNESKNKVIAFDPNIRTFMIKDRETFIKRMEKWLGICTIAKISSEDFEYIYPDLSPEEALQKTIKLGTCLAIVTLGCDGAIALLKRDDGSVLKVSVPGVKIPKVADTVGAGDTFQGALLAWFELRGKLSHNDIINISESDLNDALIFANKAAAFVCTRDGAQPPTMKELE